MRLKPIGQFQKQLLLIQPAHDKTNKMTCAPRETQISLGIHPVWSELVVTTSYHDIAVLSWKCLKHRIRISKFKFLYIFEVKANWAVSKAALINSACAWQNKQNDLCTPRDSDQPGYPPSLIRVFAVHSMGSWGPHASSCAQQRLWSDWANAQADLSLRCAHMPFCWFCHAVAQMILVWSWMSVLDTQSVRGKFIYQLDNVR